MNPSRARVITPFFITGLPRTRSAWLAALFNIGRCEAALCYHEPDEPVSDLVQRSPGTRVGVSDSTLVFDFEALRDKFPSSPWLFIERDPREAARSLIKFSAPTVRLFGRDIEQVFSAHARASQAVKAYERTLVVPYEQLDKRIEEAWLHVFGFEPSFDRKRYEILAGLRIEQRMEMFLKTKLAAARAKRAEQAVGRDQLQRFHD